MVMTDAAGDGVRGLEGADTPLPLLLDASDLLDACLLSELLLIICRKHMHTSAKDFRGAITSIGNTNPGLVV
jgi:hypothetical protein